MRVICEQKDLLSALHIAGKAVSGNNTLPILGNILLKAEGQKLYFAATNLEIAITYWLSTEVKNEGSITIPAKLLTSYVSLLPGGLVEMAIDEGNSISLKSGSSKTKIKGISSEEFPVIPVVEREYTIEVSGKELRQAIEQVVFAAATVSTRPVLSGVFFRAAGDELRLAATDSYRLAERKVKLAKPIEGELKIIVPARTVQELARLISDEHEIVTIITSPTQILAKIGNIELTSRVIDGQFPDYQQIIPKSHKTKVATKISDLTQAIRRVALFAKENNNNNIKFSFTAGGNIGLTTDITQIGVEEAEIPGTTEGEENRVALNADFVLDVLSVLGTEEAEMLIESKLAPVVIMPKGKTEYTHIIMPLKI